MENSITTHPINRSPLTKYEEMSLDAKIPQGPLAEKWSKHKFNLKLVNPSNKRKYDVIVVGTGLAGASAAASLAELGL
jgi:succinate dehydrogenase / fumarate reductase flavoprotein subunit